MKMDFFALSAAIEEKYGAVVDTVRDPAGRFYGSETNPVYVVTVNNEYTPMFGVGTAPLELYFLESVNRSGTPRDRLSVYSGYTLYEGVIYPDEIGRVTLETLDKFVPLRPKLQKYVDHLDSRVQVLVEEGAVSELILEDLGLDVVSNLKKMLV